jgi:hypothetical protein
MPRGLALLAIFANCGFIFSARPAKVKTFYLLPTAPVAAAFACPDEGREAGAFFQCTCFWTSDAWTIAQRKINQTDFLWDVTPKKPPTNSFLPAAICYLIASD